MNGIFRIVLAVACWLSVFGSDVIELDTKNFEHLTQASSGSTTGDWLIKFYAPWCGHCKTLAPIFEEVATQLKGEVNVAHVDVTQSRDLGTRFEIQGFPTVKLLSKGQSYTFKGRRSVDELVQFARGGYQIHQPEVVRKPMGMFGEILYVYEHAFKQAGKDLRSGNYFTIDVTLTFLPVVFAVILLVLICLPSPTPSRRALEDDEDDVSTPTSHSEGRPNARAASSRSDSANKDHSKSD